MKSFLFRIYLAWMKLLVHFVRTDPQQVTILNGAGRSGSNGFIFYRFLKHKHPELRVSLIEPWPSSHLPWKDWRAIGRAKFLLTTHQPFKAKRDQVNLQFWHGVPLKRMGIMARNTKRRDNRRNERLWQRDADVVASSGAFYETLMSSCMGIEAKKYRRIGFPRIDALTGAKMTRQQILRDLFGQTDPAGRIGIYMPTFRYEMGGRSVMQKIAGGNFFAFNDFDAAFLNERLKGQRIYLLVKLHPYEMRLFQHPKSPYSNIAFLNNDYLLAKDVDLYDMLGATSFLITDFSSIYYDYLHLNKPIFFVTNLLKEYEQVRGLLLGPYKQVVPGACVSSQAGLVAALSKLEADPWAKKRHYWLHLSSQTSGSACENAYRLMRKLGDRV